MICNDAGLAIIKEFEGCRLQAYQDGRNIWTIGYGHTQGVTQGDTITQQQADDMLIADLHNVEAYITRYVRRPLNDNQFSALCALTFNIGVGNFGNSTLLHMINAGLFANAPAAFLRWIHIHKPDGTTIVSDGLLRRRKAEIALFNQSA